MRLFHVSEESGIDTFIPRIPERNDLSKSKGLVWAINEQCLFTFLTPRECPRVAYYASKTTSQEDIAKYFSTPFHRCIAVEYGWFERTAKTTLYLYEFNLSNFYSQDTVAGYYVSEQAETPVNVTKIDDLFAALFERSVEVRLINNLWALGDAVQESTLNWGLFDMWNALPRPQ